MSAITTIILSAPTPAADITVGQSAIRIAPAYFMRSV